LAVPTEHDGWQGQPTATRDPNPIAAARIQTAPFVREFLMRTVALVLLFLGCLTTAAAEGLSAAQIEEISRIAREAREARQLPALSVAVIRDDRLWSAAFGSADLEQNVPATAQSMFRTASIGKWFTATAAMRLAEDGRLDLDAPVQRYCPQYPAKPWPVTARQLLSHQAGVRHYYGDNGEKPQSEAERAELAARVARERAGQYVRHTDMVGPLDIFKDDALLFEPGTRTRYSSLGYRLLGCVLEGAAKKPYRQLMRELVFAPAGMTSITDDDARAVVPHRVPGYSRPAGGPTLRAEFRDVSENLPAGGWLATSEDLARFAQAFASGRLVKIATRDQMVQRPTLTDGTPAPNPMGSPDYYYGLGVMVGPLNGKPAWFHTGGQSGATALLYWYPDRRVVVALMTNLDGRAINEELATKIAAVAGGE
jgi:serine beta-lactamase-like protein LACTB